MMHEALVVAQERLREGSLQIGTRVTRLADALAPLLFVLVAGKTTAHGGHGRAPTNDAAVTGNALSANRFHSEVSIVIEGDRSARSLRFASQDRHDAVRVVAVAARTEGRLGEL